LLSHQNKKMKEEITMKNFKKQIAAGVLALSLLSASGLALANETNFGSAGALADPSYTLEEMLTYAIQDEYAAKAEYQAIQDAFGVVRIYSNILKAEAQHVEILLPLFETYEITVPAEIAPEEIVLPADLVASYGLAVEAEVNNIAMYEAFLKEDLPEDVQFAFENLMNASESHLVAFQRAADGNIGGGFVQSRQGNSNAQSQMMGNGVANAQGQAMGYGVANAQGQAMGYGVANAQGQAMGYGVANAQGQAMNTGIGNGNATSNARGNTVAPRQQLANNNLICR
jgi:hypothetical protein